MKKIFDLEKGMKVIFSINTFQNPKSGPVIIGLITYGKWDKDGLWFETVKYDTVSMTSDGRVDIVGEVLEEFETDGFNSMKIPKHVYQEIFDCHFTKESIKEN